MTPPLQAQPSSRLIHSLNGVRGIAILLVLCVHLVHLSFVTFPGAVGHAVSNTMWLGWTGVDLFFVLSGFLITGILLDTRTSPNFFRSFYIRRALRIFPLYYLIVAVAAAVTAIARGVHARAYAIGKTDLLALMVYLQNYRPLPIMWGHLWSLALEEQFYLLWPLVVFLIRSRRALAWTIVGLLLAVNVGRLAALTVHGRHFPLDNRLYFHGDGLLIGALLAMAVRYEPALRRTLKVAPAASTASLLGFLWIAFGPAHEIITRDTWSRMVGFPLLSILFGGVVLLAWKAERSGSRTERVLRTPFLQVSGKYSYGLYVYHAPIMVLMRFAVNPVQRIVTSPALLFVAGLSGVALSYAIAFASFKMYESPILRFKERFTAITATHREHPDFPEKDVLTAS